MKNFIIMLFIFGIAFNSFSQDLSISKSSLIVGSETVDSWQVMLEPEAKTVKKAWEDFLQSNYNTNVKGIGLFANKDILTAENVNFEGSANGSLKVFARIIPWGNRTQMDVYAKNQSNNFIGNQEMDKEFDQSRTLVNSFMSTFLNDYYLEVFNDMQKKVDDLDKKQRDLTDENVKLKTEISKHETEIDQLSKEINKKSNQIENNKIELEQTVNNYKENLNQLEEIRKKIQKIDLTYNY